jgi:outer membrane protein
MMKKLLFVLFLVVTTTTAVAQIGYVRYQTLLLTMPESASANKELSELRGKLQKTMQKAEVNAEEKIRAIQYKAQDPTLDDAKKKALQEEYVSLQTELASLEQKSKREMADLENKLLSPIAKKLNDAINKIAKQKGLKMVVDAATVVYAEDGLDISFEVSKELGIAIEE